MSLLDDFNCESCSEEQKKCKGCNGHAVMPYMMDENGRLSDIFTTNMTEQSLCPKKQVKSISYYYLSVYCEYERGHYLWGGGVMDQSSFYLSVMHLIQKEISLIKKVKEKHGNNH